MPYCPASLSTFSPQTRGGPRVAFVLGHLEIFKLNKKLTVGRCLKKNQAWVPQGKTIIDRWALAVCLSVKDQVLQKHWVKQKEWLICWPLPKLGTVKIGLPGVTLCTMVCDGVTRKTYQLGIDQKIENLRRAPAVPQKNWKIGSLLVWMEKKNWT